MGVWTLTGGRWENAMKTIKLNAKQLDAMNPEHLAVIHGDGDTLLENGKDLMKRYTEDAEEESDEDRKTPTLTKALKWNLKEVSRNYFEIVVLKDGELLDAGNLDIWE
jgi:hypothetical protein